MKNEKLWVLRTAKFYMKSSEKFRSLPEGAVERSETEGVKKITSNYKELPQSFFLRKNDSLALLRYPILLMWLGAPHKIDRCADRCSLYPSQAAVAYVAQRWGESTNQI